MTEVLETTFVTDDSWPDGGPLDSGFESLYELTATIATSDSPEAVFDLALQCLCDVLRVQRSAILIADEQGIFRFRSWWKLSDSYRITVDGHSPWQAGDPNPQPVLVPDVRDDESLAPFHAALESEGIVALAFIPLVGRDGLFGKFMLYYAEPHPFTRGELVIARTIAAQVAFAIEHDQALNLRRRTNQILSARERTINAMFRSPVVGVAEITPQGQFVTVNDRFCELAGRTRAELVNDLDCIVITHEEDQAATRRCLESLSAGEEHFTFEKRYVRPDGSITWVAKSVSAIRDEPGGPLRGAIAVATDVTERKLHEEKIRQSEARYRSLIESLGVAVYTTDEAGRITLYNREAETIWGRKPEPQDRWTGSQRIFHPNGSEIPPEECPMAVALKERRPVRNIDIIVERPDGSRANILPYPTPLFDFFGRLTGAVNVLVDITALKLAESGLQEALRAKDDFLGQISHELKNPVTQIGGYSDLILKRKEDLPEADMMEALYEIRVQTARVQRLIENMLVLSRVERGVMPGTEPHLLQRVIQQPIEEFRQRFPRAELIQEIPADLPPVDTSASTIDQVTWNLLTNAQKYGPATGPIVVRAWYTDGEVSVSVRDYGPGIPQEELQRLAEPYFRSSNTAAHAAGLGLGLSVCRRLLSAQNGRLWARRAEGPGMEFGFTLPALASEE